jgi:hypothetical protein
MSVPLPSLAKIEAVFHFILATPDPIDLKLTVMILPEEPMYPGLGTTPSKSTVPAELEKVGSEIQRVRIEEAFDIETT